MTAVTVDPAASLHGTARVPGDKSISHRALLLSMLAAGRSSISGLSTGDDVRRTARIVDQLGVRVARVDGVVVVDGGRERLSAAPEPLDFGNSGTGIRLAMGVVAGVPGSHVLVGDASLSGRPMDRVAEPLLRMGARISGVGERCTTPLQIEGSSLHGITYEVPVPSAQVKSAVLLAALGADGPSTVLESVRTRPHTEEMIGQAGGKVSVTDSPQGRSIEVAPSELMARHWDVSSDPSQAAFFVVAALLTGDSEVSVRNLYPDTTRIGFLSVLERMGASIQHDLGDGVLHVTSTSSSLAGTVVESEEIPSLDEVPILAVAAAAAEGTTRFVDVAELRIKESDRFSRTISLVQALGASASAEGDDIVIEGLGSARRFAVPTIDAGEDHRMAMSAAIAGVAGSGASISGFDTVDSSFPGFLDVLDGLRA